eukprot:763346-Hanusia_phi.AAC.2
MFVSDRTPQVNRTGATVELLRLQKARERRSAAGPAFALPNHRDASARPASFHAGELTIEEEKLCRKAVYNLTLSCSEIFC